jgi:hypothetical protein
MVGKPSYLNMCMRWDTISGWTPHLDLKVETIEDGDKLHILLPSPITLKNETVMEGKGNLDQPIRVLSLR